MRTSLTRIASDFQADELIDIVIKADSSTKTFKVQKALLCSASEYFVKALNGNFSEASDRRLRLPGASEDGVQTLIYWLAKRTLPDFLAEIRSAPRVEARHAAVIESHRILAEAWMLADQVMMSDMRSDVMKKILAIMEHHGTPFEAVSHAWKIGAGLNLGDAYVVEARYEYFHGIITDNDLLQLTRLDGFLKEFMSDVRERVDEDGVNFPQAARSHSNFI